MRSETEIADPVYGFTWCLTDGQHYVRNADGDIRAVNEQTVELLRLFARGELTREALCRQRVDSVTAGRRCSTRPPRSTRRR